MLRPEHFLGKENRAVFQAAVDIWDAGGSPDYVTVTEHTGLQREVVQYYREFDEGLDNIEEYANLIIGKAVSRRLVELGSKTAERALTSDPFSLLDELEKELMRVRPQRGDGFQRAELLGRVKLSDRPSLIPTGFPVIDFKLKGLGNGRLITLAARPGVGKTTLAEGILANVCKQGLKVGMFSLEMTRDELIEKLVLAESATAAWQVEQAALSPDDIERIGRALVRMSGWEIWLDDTASMTTFELATRAKRLKAERGLDLVIVDYLQLIIPPKAENRVNEVSQITRSLKNLAKDLGVPVLMLSQLSRQAEMGDGEPQLWHLRDSGSIEQDSDSVIFLWRDKDAGHQDVVPTHGKVAKNRQGPTGYFELALQGAMSRFVEW